MEVPRRGQAGLAQRANRRPRRPDRGGQSLVELAIALPVLLLLLLGTVDIGRLFFGYIDLTNAVREGAGYASHQPADNSGIAAAVTRHSADIPAASIAVTCSNGACSNAKAGDFVSVAATWTFRPLFGSFLNNYFGIGPINLQTDATMKVL